MRVLIELLWLAGIVQLLILAANFILPGKLDCRAHVARMAPMIREIFIVHWAYIAAILCVFSVLSLCFAPELAGASRLGRFLAGFIAVFWLMRVPIQLFFYDPEIRRQNRLGDVIFLLAFSYLGMVFSAAALGFGR